MGFWGTLFNALQYAPLVLEVTKAMQGKPDDSPEKAQEDLRQQAQVQQRQIDALQQDVTNLRDRVRQLESVVATLQLWAWIGLTSLGILVVIMLIVVLTTRH